MRATGDALQEALLPALFARATAALQAILALGEQGFGQQAMMLNRPLFELMVDAHWVHANPELANERFLQHARFEHHLGRRAARRHPQAFAVAPPPEDDDGLGEDELPKLRDLYGPYGTKSWTSLNLHQRLEAVERQWNEEGCRELWFFHDVINRANNGELHPGSWSLGRVLRLVPQEGGGSRVQFRIGPEPEQVTVALYNALWTYSQVLGLVIGAFGMPLQEELNGVLEDILEVFPQ